MGETQVEVQAYTRDGRAWKPSYLLTIDIETCIGCGRCFKSCGRGVMSLQGLPKKAILSDWMRTRRFYAR